MDAARNLDGGVREQLAKGVEGVDRPADGSIQNGLSRSLISQSFLPKGDTNRRFRRTLRNKRFSGASDTTADQRARLSWLRATRQFGLRGRSLPRSSPFPVSWQIPATVSAATAHRRLILASVRRCRAWPGKWHAINRRGHRHRFRCRACGASKKVATPPMVRPRVR